MITSIACGMHFLCTQGRTGSAWLDILTLMDQSDSSLLCACFENVESLTKPPRDDDSDIPRGINESNLGVIIDSCYRRATPHTSFQ